MANAQIKLIPGYKRHYISSDGKPYSKRNGRLRLLKTQQNRGYLYTAFSENGKTVYPKVHRLVLLAFVGKPKKGQITRHLDGNKTNNNIDNLVWGTFKENMGDKIRHGTLANGEKSGVAKLNELQVRIIRRCRSVSAKFLGFIFGVSVSGISSIWNEYTWKHLNLAENKRAKALTMLCEVKNNGKLNFAQYRILLKCAHLPSGFLCKVFSLTEGGMQKYKENRIDYSRYGWSDKTLGQYIRDLITVK